MSSEVKARPIRVPEPEFYYTMESLHFARSVLSDLEDQLKEKAIQLTSEAGRNTVTVEDMQQAVDAILGPAKDEVDEPGSGDA